jgi:hypothetical protein
MSWYNPTVSARTAQKVDLVVTRVLDRLFRQITTREEDCLFMAASSLYCAKQVFFWNGWLALLLLLIMVYWLDARAIYKSRNQ